MPRDWKSHDQSFDGSSSSGNVNSCKSLDRPRDALPVPILRGASLQDITHPERTSSSNLLGSACSTRTHPRRRLHIKQRSETLLQQLKQARQEQVVSDQQADRVRSVLHRSTVSDSLAVPISLGDQVFAGDQPQLASKKHLTKTEVVDNHLLRDLSLKTPVVVNRAIPEQCDPYSKHASLDLGRLYESLRTNGTRSNTNVNDGRIKSGPNQLQDQCVIQAQKQESHSEDEVQHDHSTRTTLPDSVMSVTIATPVSIASTWSSPDTADAVEQQGHHHRAITYTSCHIKAATTRWDLNTRHLTLHEDGSRKQPGCPSTPKRQSPRLPQHRSARQMHPETACSLSPTSLPICSQGLRQTPLASNPCASRTPDLLDHSVRSEICQPAPPGMNITPAMVALPCKTDGQEGSAMSLVIPLLEGLDGESLPASPASVGSSEVDAYETPMTSPSHSPIKEGLSVCRLPGLADDIVQLDGTGASNAETGMFSEQADEMLGAESVSVKHVIQDPAGTPENWSDDDLDAHLASTSHEREAASRSEHDPIDLSKPNLPNSQTLTNDSNLGVETPMAPASPAKGLGAFPFPRTSEDAGSSTRRCPSRYPGALLRHCERIATPRQRRLMTSGVQTPDRFIPSRTATPTKEIWLLAKPKAKSRAAGRFDMDSDPFGPVPRRSLRMAERYATIRSPPSPPLPVGLVGTRVQDAQAPGRRAASTGTVWTVGGTIVTEGVASITNGRGGRITSGTSATHYAADFLRKRSPSEEEIMHGRRLALAMDIDQNAQMLSPNSPSTLGLPQSSGSSRDRRDRVWRDGVWEKDGVMTPTKVKAKKSKDVPIIPFRVLDAPALRDDYYCSLLAYSPTVQCLAVGLGPHVYLWSESRGTRTIPDSLTAPYGSSHVTSVSFSSRDGGHAILAIGRADGRITLRSPLDRDPRFDSEQPAPVSCVCFRPTTVRRQSLRDSVITVSTEELLVGDEVGYVYLYSIEWPTQEQRDLFDWHGSMTILARLSCHSQQVCGLAWSPDGGFFATGGNDNQLFLFESKKILQRPSHSHRNTAPSVHVRSGSSGSSNATLAGQGEVLTVVSGQEKHVFTLNAAVKAMAFAPWQSTLLAAGGGSNDRCIHFFHTLSGANLATIDCHAQVTSLVWSEKRKEIATTFGFAQPEHPYRVAVFTWPSCHMVVKIPWWSEERALFAVAYPRGPSGGQRREGMRANTSIPTTRDGISSKRDTEGHAWYGKRTKEEGCLVVATSDASIKFHEIWAEERTDGGKKVPSGVLGGSQILEEECSGDVERWAVIR